METGSAAQFTELGTIGIEEEYFVVDADGHPVAGTDELVYESDPPAILDERLDHELFKFVVETQTPVIERLSEAGETLDAVRVALTEHARDHGYHIAVAGLHPTAIWREHEHAEKPRYRSQLDRIQYPQHRNTTAGLHLHVGVDDPDKAVWIANEIRWSLPMLLALSANSPFWCGCDTGLHSARATIFENLPNTGIPTAFPDFDTFARFEQRMVASGSIADRGELWFDVRPHSELGTVEIRTPDAQADQDRVIAFLEYIHARVLELSDRYEDGEPATEPRREVLDENKWRAIRHGHDASFLKRSEAENISLETVVNRECERLDVRGIKDILAAESGAERQRRIARAEDMDAVCRDLII